MNFKLFALLAAFVGIAAAEGYERVVKPWGGNQIATYKYTAGACGSAETQIKAAGRGVANVRVNGAYTVWIGTDAANLSQSGYPLFDNESINLDSMGSAVYACSAAGDADVRVLEGE